jgi:replicative DNA helicase
MQATRPDQDDYAKISEISRMLKVMARELRIPVLALSQMSRDSEKGAAPREPRLSDLRGSGSIEQDADAVLFIHRVDNEDREGPDAHRTIKVIIAKNRFGPTGQTLMRFFPAKMSFEQAAAESEDEGRVVEAYASRSQRSKQQPGGSEDLFADDAPTP